MHLSKMITLNLVNPIIIYTISAIEDGDVERE